jgi:hypothetical protein
VCATGYITRPNDYQACYSCAPGFGNDNFDGKCKPCSSSSNCACPTGQVYDAKTSKCGGWQAHRALRPCGVKWFRHPAACGGLPGTGAACACLPRVAAAPLLHGTSMQ